MGKETSDFVLGVAVLIPFVIACIAAGWALSRFKNARYERAWEPLRSLLDGAKVVGDGGGAATSWLTGSYRGQDVAASMVPNRNVYSGESGSYYNYFDVALRGVRGGQEWRLEYDTPALSLLGKPGWRFRGTDPALEARLRAAGVVDLVAGMGGGVNGADYSPHTNLLRLTADVTPAWTPTPEQFRAQLDLLLRLKPLAVEEDTATGAGRGASRST